MPSSKERLGFCLLLWYLQTLLKKGVVSGEASAVKDRVKYDVP
jgi:hypothetical protein